MIIGAPVILVSLVVALSDWPGSWLVASNTGGFRERFEGRALTGQIVTARWDWGTYPQLKRSGAALYLLHAVDDRCSPTVWSPRVAFSSSGSGTRWGPVSYRGWRPEPSPAPASGIAQLMRIALAADDSAGDLVQQLVAGLSSDDCATRRSSLRTIFPKLLDQNAPFHYVPALREEIAKADPEMQRKLNEVLAPLESWASFRAHRKEALEQLLIQKLDPERFETNPKSQRGLRNEFLAIIRNPDENIHVRLYAGSVMTTAVRNHPGAEKDWAPSLVRLLRDRDPVTQIVGVSAILSGVQRQRIPKAGLAAPLIKNLRHPSPSVRQIAQNFLEAIVGRQVCLDPTDLEETRESAILQWEAWWNTNRSRLEKERLK